MDPNSKSKKPKKNIDFTLHSLWGKQQEGANPVIQPEIFTASGAALRSQICRQHAVSVNFASRSLSTNAKQP